MAWSRIGVQLVILVMITGLSVIAVIFAFDPYLKYLLNIVNIFMLQISISAEVIQKCDTLTND